MMGGHEIKPVFGNNKNIELLYASPSSGQFALEQEPPKTISWDNCREQFLGKMSVDMRGFFFTHHDGKSDDVACFIAKIEEVVSLSGLSFVFSSFRKTNKINIIWIEPGCLWRNGVISMSLLTLMLRSSLNYDMAVDNFQDCLFGNFQENRMIRETKQAVLRFMFGFTKYVGELPPATNPSYNSTLIRHGWHSEFNFSDLVAIKRKLVSAHEGAQSEKFGFDFIWN